MRIIYTSVGLRPERHGYPRRMVRAWRIARSGEPVALGEHAAAFQSDHQLLCTILRASQTIPARLHQGGDLEKAGIFLHCLSRD